MNNKLVTNNKKDTSTIRYPIVCDFYNQVRIVCAEVIL